jgi:hypothetical protein
MEQVQSSRDAAVTQPDWMKCPPRTQVRGTMNLRQLRIDE